MPDQAPATQTTLIAGSNPVDENLPRLTTSPPDVTELRSRLVAAQAKHNKVVDSIMFNGGTIAVLALTAAATFIPSLNPSDGVKWIAPLCSGLAGLFVAMERALGFGARWRFHREMVSGYESIIDMLDFFPVLPITERDKYSKDIFAALYSLRAREAMIPNTGGGTST